jgi:hypothetical protein
MRLHLKKPAPDRLFFRPPFSSAVYSPANEQKRQIQETLVGQMPQRCMSWASQT